MEDLETPPEPPAIAEETSAREQPPEESATGAPPALSMEELLSAREPENGSLEDAQLRAVLEAIVYVAEEPLTLVQLAAALQQPAERIRGLLDEMIAEFEKPEHGVTVREVAGGF